MRQVNPRVFWILLVAAGVVAAVAAAVCGQEWVWLHVIGLTAGLCLGGAAFIAALEPDDNWEIIFRKDQMPIIRRRK